MLSKGLWVACVIALMSANAPTSAGAIELSGAPELLRPVPGGSLPASQQVELAFALPLTDAQTCSLWTLDISVKREGERKVDRYLSTPEWQLGLHSGTPGDGARESKACLASKRIQLGPGQWSVRATATHSLGYGRPFSDWVTFTVHEP